jgi:two-component system, cell cycle response regulator
MKILVVDDDSAARKKTIKTLKDAGYATIEGQDGQQALSLVKEESPDLLIMDIEMPRMSGHQACRIIKGSKGFPFFPIILVTARSDLQTKVEGLEMGADDYLMKPLNKLELLARVKSMLRLKTLQDDLIATNKKLQGINDRLQELSMTDPLMEICNRLYFEKRIVYEFQRAERYRTPLALLMLDLDHFKNVNDTYGHLYGDYVLKHTAEVLTASVRQVDIVARYGGEEIVVACPETDGQQSLIVANRIRRNVDEAVYSHEGVESHVTVSIGVAVCPDANIKTAEELLNKADEALYVAKEEGRNCVRTAFEEEFE